MSAWWFLVFPGGVILGLWIGGAFDRRGGFVRFDHLDSANESIRRLRNIVRTHDAEIFRIREHANRKELRCELLTDAGRKKLREQLQNFTVIHPSVVQALLDLLEDVEVRRENPEA